MIRRLLGVVWALPVTLPAVAAAALFCVFRGRMRYSDGAFDCFGPSVQRALAWLPVGGTVSAITLGHVIFSQDAETADRLCTHERIHVRQYERWGPIFPLAYFASSAMAWSRGKCPYQDNVFEREARESGC